VPGHSPSMHPKRPVLGPEPLKDPRNFVPPLEPMFGPRGWDRASEVDPRTSCARCGNSVRARGIVCGGCTAVHPDHDRKLTAERRADPAPEKKPAARPKAAPRSPAARKAIAAAEKRDKLTARTRKRMLEAYRRCKGVPEADAWAARLGLLAAS
jgi:hypothetical protein